MPHSCRSVPGHESIAICDLTGRIDAAGSAALKQDLDALTDRSAFKLVVTLHGLQLMSAAGLNVLLAYGQRAKAARGDVRFAGASPDVARLMELARLTRYFKFFPTEGEALKSLTG